MSDETKEKTKKQLIAVDVGNGYTKSANLMGDTLIFPTVMLDKTSQSFDFASMSADFEAQINNSVFYFGEMALLKGGARNWLDDVILNPFYEYVTAFSVFKNFKGENGIIDLCLGLPYAQYIAYKKSNNSKLENMFSGKTYEMSEGDVKKSISIDRVLIYPQGVGAYFSNIYDATGSPVKGAEEYINSLIIDIGYRTTDVVAFNAVNLKFQLVEKNCFSLPNKGMSSITTSIATKLSQKADYSPNDIEQAIINCNKKLRNVYGDIDLSGEYEKEKETLALDIANNINARIASDLNKFSRIFVSGGGGTEMYPYLKKYFGNIYLQKKSQFSNCKGYLALKMSKKDEEYCC